MRDGSLCPGLPEALCPGLREGLRSGLWTGLQGSQARSLRKAVLREGLLPAGTVCACGLRPSLRPRVRRVQDPLQDREQVRPQLRAHDRKRADPRGFGQRDVLAGQGLPPA